MIFKDAENLLRYIIHGLIAIHRNQPSGALIVIRYRTSLLLVGRQTGLNHFQPVVIAGYQLRPVTIANFIDRGG